ncbi:MAG: hypothetical protein K6G37_00625 [Bacilli bacterium]|nr:hypothetical protein [Bacilli bacterium]
MYGLKPHQEGQFKNIDIRSYMNTPYFSLNDIKKLLREYEDVCGCKNPSLARIRRKTLKSKE